MLRIYTVDQTGLAGIDADPAELVVVIVGADPDALNQALLMLGRGERDPERRQSHRESVESIVTEARARRQDG